MDGRDPAPPSWPCRVFCARISLRAQLLSSALMSETQTPIVCRNCHAEMDEDTLHSPATFGYRSLVTGEMQPGACLYLYKPFIQPWTTASRS